MRLIWFFAAALLLGGLSTPWIDSAMGQSSIPDRANQDRADQDDATEDSVETWIEMLGSPRYSDRVEATAKLQRSGVSAIKALKQAVLDGQVETSNRALDILRRHHRGEDAVLKNAAETALREIAALDHAKAHAASKVLESAESRANAEAPAMLPPFPLIPRAPIFGNRAAGNQIFGRAIGGNQRIKIQVKITNGDREVTIEENGKKIHVAKKSDGIDVEKTDENGVKKKAHYKDIDELKKRDPEAHKAYQRAGAGIEIKIGGRAQAPQAALPDEIRKRRQEMLDRRDEILKRHEELRKQHFERVEEMKRVTPRDSVPIEITPQQKPVDDDDAGKTEETDDKTTPAPPRGGLKV